CVRIDRGLVNPTGADICEISAIPKQRQVKHHEAGKDSLFESEAGDVIAEGVIVIAVHQPRLADKLLAVGVIEEDVTTADDDFWGSTLFGSMRTSRSKLSAPSVDILCVRR